ncbi:MAG TPA: biopolymer transporter ExbD, partial [Oceanicaulis sp.]
MARRQSRVLQDDEEVQLDMTPMLDVVFILLIFF